VTLAVVAGAAVWAALWTSGTRLTQVALPELAVPGRPLTHPGVLAWFIGYSAALSVLAGLVASRVAGREKPMRAVAILSALQLALGIVAEASYWNLAPLWYHLVFLALVVPATLYGGTLAARWFHTRRAAGLARAG
jgi:hypothetical protein